jgi:hypothetical protein
VPMHTKFKPLLYSITEAYRLSNRVVNFVTDLMKSHCCTAWLGGGAVGVRARKVA